MHRESIDSGQIRLLYISHDSNSAGVKIIAVRIIVYFTTFSAVIGLAAAIAALSIVVAAPQQKSDGLTLLAIALGGLGVAGGVVYLGEKLVNLAKELAHMVAEYIVEKYKRHRWKQGRKAERKEWMAWYERQQAALRNSQPFDELPPGYSEEENGEEQV